MNIALIKELDPHAPIKQKYIGANDRQFMTKELGRAIIHKSKLKHKYNKYKTEDNWKIQASDK